ncbi:uncharacterized protein LOC118736614 [Rhagoletis pomonella]|uniref:uncharacterized protein LOC118736614 n=1 Tax=Rhagoletis pomonella TaxID=28610 RepID=UPI00178366C4|nr:uncharacterized protein LOC118736614 [Rhagoletis pomonella]
MMKYDSRWLGMDNVFALSNVSHKGRPTVSYSETSLKYGISPLHAWIRCLEFILHLSYRMDLKKWQIRSQEDKEVLKQKKSEIQEKFWKHMGLRVDKPKANGSGNTNDGNSARRAISDPEMLAKITSIDKTFLKNLKTILICISCEFQIDVELFFCFCKRTFDIYMEKYDWYAMSATLHKILVHSAQIMQSSSVPLGCLGENASESRNKCYKRDRVSHARKNSRENNMKDVFDRAMDSSDPLLSSMHLSKRIYSKKKQTFPPEVVALLKSPPNEFDDDKPTTSRQALEEFDEICSDDNEDMDDSTCFSIELEEESWD